jgi:hypothetical protein
LASPPETLQDAIALALSLMSASKSFWRPPLCQPQDPKGGAAHSLETLEAATKKGPVIAAIVSAKEVVL